MVLVTVILTVSDEDAERIVQGLRDAALDIDAQIETILKSEPERFKKRALGRAAEYRRVSDYVESELEGSSS